MHAVIGLSQGGAARGAAALAQLREHGMCGRATNHPNPNPNPNPNP